MNHNYCGRIIDEFKNYKFLPLSISNSGIDYEIKFIFSEKLVLIGEDGAKWASGDNTSFIVNGKYWVNNHAHVIRPFRNIILDEWIVYYLNFSDLTVEMNVLIRDLF